MKTKKPIIDLFEFFDTLPEPVQDAINEAGEMGDYDQCAALKTRLNALGFDFEYGLDGVPYDLHKIN